MPNLRFLPPLLALSCLIPLISPSETSFYESFEESWEGRWIPSGNEDYKGTWKHAKSEGHEDFGLLVSEKARKYGIVKELPEWVHFHDGPVVLQYDLRLQDGIECGGAYVKFLAPQAADWSPSQFDNESPYSIMFGPDKCGSTNKVHFIFRHKHPKTQKFIEHHLKYPPTPINDKLSHVYTAVVYPNNTVKILVDGEVKQTSDLLSNDFEPPLLPPKTIPDPEDKKPEDWDERAKIPDPDASKPDDWDEDEPMEIEDLEAVKPEGWLDDEPEEIDDAETLKPDDWDDEEDGEWEPLKVPNPKCADAPGCGKWTRPTKRNPAYKGKWYAPMIDNPDYKGIWKAREIPNPDYFELDKPDLQPVTAIGIEIWTMQDGFLFDNFLIARDEGVAKEYREKTWAVKYDVEKQKQKKEESVGGEDSFFGGLQSRIFKLLYRILDLPLLGAYREKLTGLVEKGEEKGTLTLSILAGIMVVILTAMFRLLFGGKKPSRAVNVPFEKVNKEDLKEDVPTQEDATVDGGKEEPAEGSVIESDKDGLITEEEKEREEANGVHHRKARTEN